MEYNIIMNAFRRIIIAITIIIAAFVITGLIMVIISPKTLADSVYDLIILTVSGISIAIALYTEAELSIESRRVDKMVKEINKMRKNVDDDMSIDKNVRYKLDKIIALDEQIYKKLGGRKKTSTLVKEKETTAAKTKQVTKETKS